MIPLSAFRQVTDDIWEIPASFRGDLRVPARVYASRPMLERVAEDRALDQLLNLAALPGVQRYVLAMPDVHEGYGSPVGGVADTAWTRAASCAGMIGYDINCGVRLLRGA